MIQVAVSILSFNSSESTIACVRSLLAGVREAGDSYHLDIMVADNDSSVDEQRQLQLSLAQLPVVDLHINSANLGFAAGHNKNLQAIFVRSRPDYIWLLNNDCMVNKETLVALIECAQKNPEVGIWGATLLEQDGQTIQCAGGCFYNSWISSYRQYGRRTRLAQIDQLTAADFDYIAGASLFFPLKTLQDGLRPIPVLPGNTNADGQQWLNERFFLYFEELDLAQRLKPGVTMAWCRDALIQHTGGTSTGTGGQQRTPNAEYHATLSALKFTEQYYPHRLWVMAPVRFLSKCVQLLMKGQPRLLASITRAYRDFWSK